MGFLSMIGLVTAKEHVNLQNLFNRVSAERNQALIDLSKAQGDRDKFKQQVRDTCTRAEKAEEKLVSAEKLCDEAIDKYADLASKYDDVVEENLALRPDAEAMRKKRKDDVDRAAAKRAAKTAAKAAILDVVPAKIGEAIGKPRTGISAKVGKTATAVISGDRPAKKGARK